MALADYDKAISLLSRDADLYLGRAQAYMMLERFAEAELDISRAFSVEPDYPLAYVYRGILLMNTDQPEEAEADFEKARSLGVMIHVEALQ